MYTQLGNKGNTMQLDQLSNEGLRQIIKGKARDLIDNYDYTVEDICQEFEMDKQELESILDS